MWQSHFPFAWISPANPYVMVLWSIRSTGPCSVLSARSSTDFKPCLGFVERLLWQRWWLRYKREGSLGSRSLLFVMRCDVIVFIICQQSVFQSCTSQTPVMNTERTPHGFLSTCGILYYCPCVMLSAIRMIPICVTHKVQFISLSLFVWKCLSEGSSNLK